MKILQLIDTLHIGGAERVALNYANSLHIYGIESHICITREKGSLYTELGSEVNVHFLNKKNTLDVSSLKRLITIIKKNNIDIVHAHGSSWFFAAISKIVGHNFKLIWHDHYGNSEFLENRNQLLLDFFSTKFDGIISVNKKLRDWALENLKCKKVLFLNNFIKRQADSKNHFIRLKGTSKVKLVCVANLRPQKDHLTLIEAYKILKKEDFDISLHLFGKQNEDQYSREILEKIKSIPSVFWYGEKMDIYSYLFQADIGVLSSSSEGLPLALLEYANAGLGVVTTKVGECKQVIGSYGQLVKPNDPIDLANGILFYLNDQNKLVEDSHKLQSRIKRLYSEEWIIPKYLAFCEEI